jgi:hypothetical protein
MSVKKLLLLSTDPEIFLDTPDRQLKSQLGLKAPLSRLVTYREGTRTDGNQPYQI